MRVAETVYGAGDVIGYDFPQLQRSFVLLLENVWRCRETYDDTIDVKFLASPASKPKGELSSS